MGPWYVSLKDLKDSIAIPDAMDDDQLADAIEGISRGIEEHCNREFHPRIQTRYFGASGARLYLEADLLSVTTLKTDTAGDRTYATTWATTDYDLGPDNAGLGAIPRPYWWLEASPLGRYSLPCARRSIQIVGTWGFYDQRQTSEATLAEDLDASETGVNVSDGTRFSVGHTLKFDSEQVFVTDVAGDTLTVERGANGTTAATHTSGAAIDVYVYPRIGGLAKIQASHMFRLKDAPGGMVGGADFGGLKIAPAFHPQVYRGLDPFRLSVIA